MRRSGEIEISAVAGEGDEAQPLTAGPAAKRRFSSSGLLAAVVGVATATSMSALVFGRGHIADVVMLYLLGVVLVAMRFGHGPSVVAALLSVVSFDFFFVPPYLSFAVSDLRHVTTFAVMFLVAVVISELTQRARRQAESARAREKRTAALYALSRDIAAARTSEELIRGVARRIDEVFGCQCAVLLPEGGEALVVADESSYVPVGKELGVAEWVWLRERPAGLGTETLPSASALYLPLRAARGRVGVLGILPTGTSPFHDPEQRQLLETFAHQIAPAIERSKLIEQAQRALVQVETEQLRNALLSSVSHDLRTPLAVVKGAGSALLAGDDTLSPEERREYAESIVDEADRLNRLVGNLLDMTRLEGGALRANKEWHSLEEVVGTALSRLEDRLRRRKVVTDIPLDLPLVSLDGLLIEQVLINLIENATRHTPEGTDIEIRARCSATELEVEVADRGPGIPSGQEEKVFEKFHRGREGQGGIGLGLAICRGIVAVHGGHIWFENREGGGAVVRFTLPMGSESPKLDRLESLPSPAIASAR